MKDTTNTNKNKIKRIFKARVLKEGDASDAIITNREAKCYVCPSNTNNADRERFTALENVKINAAILLADGKDVCTECLCGLEYKISQAAESCPLNKWIAQRILTNEEMEFYTPDFGIEVVLNEKTKQVYLNKKVPVRYGEKVVYDYEIILPFPINDTEETLLAQTYCPCTTATAHVSENKVVVKATIDTNNKPPNKKNISEIVKSTFQLKGETTHRTLQFNITCQLADVQ